MTDNSDISPQRLRHIPAQSTCLGADRFAWVDCELHQEYDGGDHRTVVGAVRAPGARDDAEPHLVFKDGYYAGVQSRAGLLESVA